MSKNSSKKSHPTLAEFAKKIRLRRHELQLTQEQVAERAGFHTNFVGGLERGTRNPSLTSIMQLAKALKISPKDLIPD